MYDRSLFVAYFLCLFGGMLGLHQFYLRRDYHGLILLMTLGFFRMGMIRDLWKLPKYVQDANDDYRFLDKLDRKMHKYPKSPFRFFRNIGQFVIADLLAHLALYAIPQKLLSVPYIYYILTSVVPFASAVGVYLVGNIGRQEGKFKDALIGAYLTLPVTLVRGIPIGVVSIASCVYFNSYSKRWRRTFPYNKSVGQRITFISFAVIIYLSMLSSTIYFNCHITIQDEKTVKCQDAVKHFFKSPFWREFEIVMSEVWKSLEEHSWQEIWQQLIDAMDLTGEANALKVLGLNETATREEITIRCLDLSSTWDPDKHEDPEKKQIAQEIFIQIQQAYEILFKMSEKKVMKSYLKDEL